VRVSVTRTGRSTVVRINNRGPYVRGRIIDLSLVAAKEIGLTARGLTPVSLQVLGKAGAAVARNSVSKAAAPQKERKVVSLGRRSIFDNPLFN
jgi:rare lipoprotein A